MNSRSFSAVLIAAILFSYCQADVALCDENSPFRWTGRLGNSRFAHDGRITSVLPLPNGKEILSSSEDGTIRLWDLATGKELRRFSTGTGCDVSGLMRISPDGNSLTARVRYTEVHRWNFRTGKVINKLNVALGKRSAPGGDDFRTTNMAVLHCGTKVLVGYGSLGKKGHCVLWDIPTGKRLEQWTFGEDKGIHALCTLPDGKTAWIGVGSQVVKLDLETGKELRRISLPLKPFYQGKHVPLLTAKYRHGLVKGMSVVDSGRSILLYQNFERGSCSSLIDSQTGKIHWAHGQRLETHGTGLSTHEHGVLVCAQLFDVHLRKAHPLPKEVNAGGGNSTLWTFSPDGQTLYVGCGNRIYGYDRKTQKQLFPANPWPVNKSNEGVNTIWLLHGEDYVLTQTGYPHVAYALWDRNKRRHIQNKFLSNLRKGSHYNKLFDVDETHNLVVSIQNAKLFFGSLLDPQKKPIQLGFDGRYGAPALVRFTSVPTHIIGNQTRGRASTRVWWMWDVKTPKKRTKLSPPSYMSRFSRPYASLTEPKATKTTAGPNGLRFSEDRTLMAIATRGHMGRYCREDDPDMVFWAVPEMNKLGTLHTGNLVERTQFSHRIDLRFSRWNPHRMWVWRIPPKREANAWWKGVNRDLLDDSSAPSIGPRLELRETPTCERKAMGKEALAKWVMQLGADKYKLRQKASAVLESIHEDDIPLLATFVPADAEAKVRLAEIRSILKKRATDYRLRAARDLPVTVELLAEHPDGRHVLIYGRGKFPSQDHPETSQWGRGFVWLRFDPKMKENDVVFSGVLRVVRQFQLPLVARSIRFARDGELLIGTATGTVELFSSIQSK